MCRTTNCGIYKITSPKGRIYIGQAVNLKRRFKEYKKLNDRIKTQRKLYNSFKKYGVENHQFDIIEYCTEEGLNCSERFWQDEFDVLNEGLNCILQKCGENRQILSNETKKKIGEYSSARVGELNPMYGLFGEDNPNFGSKRTEEQCNNISSSLLGKRAGENNSMFGKTHNEETRKKIGDASRGQKRAFSKEHKENIKKSSQLRTGKPDYSKRKIILCLQTGIFYFGAAEASEAKNISKSMVWEQMTRLKVNKLDLIYV